MEAADGGASDEVGDGPAVMSTAGAPISAVTLGLLQNLRGTADQKVREREVHLAALRNLLFPPGIPRDKEADGHSESETLAEMAPSSFAAVQGPTMKQVQSAVEALRESSLAVVEAVQSWRLAQGGSNSVGTAGRGLETKARTSDDGVPESGMQAQDEDISTSKLQQLGDDDTQEQGRLPAVPSSSQATTTTSSTSPGAHHDQLPTYLWSRNLEALAQEDPTLANTGFAGGPDGPATEPDGSDAGDKRERVAGEGGEVVSAVDTMGSTASKDSMVESILDSGPPREEDINYLVKMTWDVDFVGAPGSVLAEMLPPDTKLFRNPFILAHNLDDTLLAGFAGKRSRASGEGGREGPPRRERGGLSAERGGDADERQAPGRGRIDPERMRRAVEIILSAETEAIPEEEGVAGCRVGSKVLPDSIKPVGEGTAEGSLGGKAGDGDVEGSVDALRGQSQAGPESSEERPSGGGQGDGGGDEGTTQDLPKIQGSQISSPAASAGGKRGKKSKRSPGEVATGYAARREDGEAAHSGGPGVKQRHHGHQRSGQRSGRASRRPSSNERGGGPWARMVPGVKEPPYKGPWVPMLLDTNVTCPEGVNEIVTEDDVTWQLAKGDRVRIGDSKGHEWRVEGIVVMNSGRGKCRVVLSEKYNHAKAVSHRGGYSRQGHGSTPQPASSQLPPYYCGNSSHPSSHHQPREAARSAPHAVGFNLAGTAGAGSPGVAEHDSSLPTLRGTLGSAPLSRPVSSRQHGGRNPGGTPPSSRRQQRSPARGGGGGGTRIGDDAAEDSLEHHMRTNLAIFERNLASLNLPSGVTRNSSGRARRNSVLGGGYKAHAEALLDVSRMRRRRVESGKGGLSAPGFGPATAPSPHPYPVPSSTASTPRGEGRREAGGDTAGLLVPGWSGRSRRFSDLPRASAAMSGRAFDDTLVGVAETWGFLHGGVDPSGIESVVRGLVRCQRIWKMIPQSRDHRPTWLRHYEDGSIPYGSHYQDDAGRRKNEVHFRVAISWAILERIVVDRPATRLFAAFRPRQRYTFFKKLGIKAIVAIAYAHITAWGGCVSGAKSPMSHPDRGDRNDRALGKKDSNLHREFPKNALGGATSTMLDIKSWHKFVVGGLHFGESLMGSKTRHDELFAELC